MQIEQIMAECPYERGGVSASIWESGARFALASLSARPAVGEDVVERIVDAVIDAANIVSHDGYYEIDRDAATRAAIAAMGGSDESA